VHRAIYWTVPFLILGTYGCNGAVEPEPEDRLPQEDLGTLLTSVQAGGTYEWWWPLFAWAPDGTEILHFPFVRGPSGLQLLAVNTSNKSTRVVADIDHNDPGMVRVPEESGAILYSAFTQYPPPAGGIYRVAPAGGEIETLLEGVAQSFAVSPDGLLLAYTVPGDSLYLLNSTDGTTHGVEQDVTNVVGVSRDGKYVLHGSAPRLELRVSSFEHGTTQAIWVQPGYERLLLGHRWDQGDVQLLYAHADQLYVRVWPSGIEQLIATLPGTAVTAAWSSDGTRIVAWVEGDCVRQDWWVCQLAQYTLHLIDTDSGSVIQIGQGNFAVEDHDRPSGIMLSPDGTRIAYVYLRGGPVGSLLYVKDVPSPI